MPASSDKSVQVQYAHRLYEDVLGWYKSADGKAQVVLTIDSAFLAFVTGTIFAKPLDLKAVVGSFTTYTWAFLALMIVCLLASVVSAIWCLSSRTYPGIELKELMDEAQAKYPDKDRCPPSTMWFFQMVAASDEKRFRATLDAVDGPFEIEAMASQISKLAKNVVTKHRLVNAGFMLAISTLGLFFLAGLSYLFKNS